MQQICQLQTSNKQMHKKIKQNNSVKSHKMLTQQQQWNSLLHDINSVRTRLLKFTQYQYNNSRQKKSLSQMKVYEQKCSSCINKHTSCDMRRTQNLRQQRNYNIGHRSMIDQPRKRQIIQNTTNNDKKKQWQVYLQNLQLMNSNLLRQKHTLEYKLHQLEKQKKQLEQYFKEHKNQFKGTLQNKKKQKKAKFGQKKDHIYTDIVPDKFQVHDNKKQYKTIDHSIEIKVKPPRQAVYINYVPHNLTTTHRYYHPNPTSQFVQVPIVSKDKKYKQITNKYETINKDQIAHKNNIEVEENKSIMNSNKTTIVNMDGISSRFYMDTAEDAGSRITNNYHRIDSSRKKKDRFSPRITFSRDGKLNYSSIQHPKKILETKCTPKSKKMTASMNDSRSEQRRMIDEKVDHQKLRMMTKYFERLVGFCKQQNNLEKKRILRQQMSELAMEMSDLREKLSAQGLQSRTYEQQSSNPFQLKPKQQKEFSF